MRFVLSCSLIILGGLVMAGPVWAQDAVLSQSPALPESDTTDMTLDTADAPAAEETTEIVENKSAACTTPPTESLSTGSKYWAYCDIYARQFAYRKNALELREKLVTRAVNYDKAQKAARQRHAEALKAHHAAIGQDGALVDKGSDPFR